MEANSATPQRSLSGIVYNNSPVAEPLKQRADKHYQVKEPLRASDPVTSVIRSLHVFLAPDHNSNPANLPPPSAYCSVDELPQPCGAQAGPLPFLRLSGIIFVGMAAGTAT